MSTEQLNEIYAQHCGDRTSDIFDYMGLLGEMSKGFEHITEMGVREVNTTWAFMWGLANSSYTRRRLVSYDLAYHPNIELAKTVAAENNVDFTFIQGNSIEVQIEQTNMLFIDTEHTYQHLHKELTLHSNNVTSCIFIHDTSGVYGAWEDWPYNHPRRGELANHPTKYGMWAGVVDFLNENASWRLVERYEVGNGLTIIERV